MDWTLECYQDLLQCGAFLVDENDTRDEPRVLVYMEHGIRDGCAGRNGRPRVISKRLQFVYLDRHGLAVDGGAAPYLDCRPVLEEEKPLVETLRQEDWLSGDIEEKARAYAVSELIPRHLQEVKPRRLEEVNRIEKAVRDRLEREIWHWDRRALELKEQEGSENKASLTKARDNVKKFTARLDKRLGELERERQIMPLPPEVRGAALVVPMGWFAKQGRAESAKQQKSSNEVEQLAMDSVMKSECALGREPMDVSSENRGYDIESFDPKSDTRVFIEVKGRVRDANDLSLTKNEMLTAFNSEGSYILAVVLVEKGVASELRYIRNPSKLFGSEPGFMEISRRFSLSKILKEGHAPC